MADEEAIGLRFGALSGVLDERMRRLIAAAEAEAIGHGGASIVSRATGVSRRAIRAGLEELKGSQRPQAGARIRKAGGGRKKTVDKDPTLKNDLEQTSDQPSHGR